MAIKKTELYASLWASCDELRGGMDASQYKNYILTLLFVKYVSDKYKGKKFPAIKVPEGGSFDDMVALKGQKNIGEQMNIIVRNLATENDRGWLSGADNDFENEERLGKGKALIDTLSNLVGIFENLNLGKNTADGDDLLGDAYEYLMRHFATESGKSKGQFYTPAEVSIVLSRVLGINEDTKQDETAYDPTCGSGSLLLKVNEQAPNGLSLYGQEKEHATASLARMNMDIHDCPSADIWQDDTISAPHWKDDDGNLKAFDYAVANPPFSLKAWSSGIVPAEDKFDRFAYGQPPGDENPIFMIDASKGYLKDGNKNRLRSQDIHKIVDVFNKQLEIDGYSRLVPYNEIAGKNEFNLNIPRYIDSNEPEDIQDLDAHLNGGIPLDDIAALQNYWNVFPTLKDELFSEDGERDGYAKALVKAKDVKALILGHSEFTSFRDKALRLFEDWKTAHLDALNGIKVGDKAKDLIFTLSEDLLVRFSGADLLSKYEIYQILMDYWRETMQDDVFMISQDDWAAANVVRQLVPVKDKKGKNVYREEADFEFGTAKAKKKYKSDILPPNLVIQKYFYEDQELIEGIETLLNIATQALEDFIEENSGEDDLLQEAKTDKGTITATSLKKRIKLGAEADEMAALEKCLLLIKNESDCKAVLKNMRTELNSKVFAQIPKIPLDEIKKLVVYDKWLNRIEAGVSDEIERMTQLLANRVKTLEERYSETLPSLDKKVIDYSGRVEDHLKQMGLSW